jgi:Tol biopolymer transport system component
MMASVRRARGGLVLGLTLLLAACGGPGSGEGTAGEAGASPGSVLAPSVSTPPQPKVALPGKIAFGRAGNIWVFQDGAAHQATTTPGAADPAWSPDGSMLAFDRQDKNSADLFVMPYPGAGPKSLSNNINRVVENNFWEMQPDWAPDGLSLAYVTDRGRTRNGVLDPAPWRITIATGARTQLANSIQYAGGIDFPRWRPDHKNQLLYTSWAYDSQTLQPYGVLMLQDTQTGQAHALTPPTESAFQASWSPDGMQIAYVKRQQKRDDLWVMSVPDSVAPSPAGTVTSSTAAKLVAQGNMSHPVWSPDGHGVAYIALKDGSLDIFVQGLNGQYDPEGQPTQVTTGFHVEGASAISWGR